MKEPVPARSSGTTPLELKESASNATERTSSSSENNGTIPHDLKESALSKSSGTIPLRMKESVSPGRFPWQPVPALSESIDIMITKAMSERFWQKAQNSKSRPIFLATNQSTKLKSRSQGYMIRLLKL